MNRFLFILSMLCLPFLLGAQAPEKRPLTHDVYDGWKRITGEVVSNDGQWIGYAIEPQEGDPRLVLFNTKEQRFDTIQRGTALKFSYNSDYAAFPVKSFFADVKKAKIAKKKGDDLPKDSLGILTLATRSLIKIPRVKSFAFPEKGAGWMAYQCEKETAAADTSKKGKKKDGEDAEETDKEKKDERGTTLILRHLASSKEYKFPFVNEFMFSKNGKRFLFASTGNDSTVAAGVFSLATGAAPPDSAHIPLDTLSSGKGKYKQLSLDEEGVQAAFVSDRDTSKAKQRFYALSYWTVGMDSAVRVVDTATAGMRSHWLVSEFGKTSFSRDGKKLFFGTAPVPLPEDTTFNDEETAKLDIWNWQDAQLQTQQVKSLETEKKRSYSAVYHVKKKRMVQLADEQMPAVTPGDEGNADIALGVSDVPYRRAQTWEGEAYNDAYLVDMVTGERTVAAKRVKGNPTLSPAAQYIAWYNADDTCWHAYNTRTHSTAALTRDFSVPLYDERNDVPDNPPSYGMMGWSSKDRDFFVYDKYDIWQLNPDGARVPSCWTQGAGRKQERTYRYINLNPEARSIDMEKDVLLSTFNNRDKADGFAFVRHESPMIQAFIVDADCSTPVKAKNDSAMIFLQSTFKESPNLYYTRNNFQSLRKLSDANPQQENYFWGSVELVHWFAADGKPLDGLLYKPENFNPSQKYPMIAYFYERNSDFLHRYSQPAPSASIVNIPLYVSQGYVVFVPDIRYRIGYPGQSAMDCIVPGVLKLVSEGFIDSTRIGIQGQSWGGYQVAYLVSHTSLFRAGMAGAPVSNMTSAYGGIRWESGMNRAFQYEKQQSRIGGTLWEKPLLYIENSALFRADFVTTPLLIMHNDADGAVPWYQGIELFTALRRLDKPVWMLTYNGEEHNLIQRKNRKDLSIRMLQFFDHYLKDVPAPVWMTKGLPAMEKGKLLRYELDK